VAAHPVRPISLRASRTWGSVGRNPSTSVRYRSRTLGSEPGPRSHRRTFEEISIEPLPPNHLKILSSTPVPVRSHDMGHGRPKTPMDSQTIFPGRRRSANPLTKDLGSIRSRLPAPSEMGRRGDPNRNASKVPFPDPSPSRAGTLRSRTIPFPPSPERRRGPIRTRFFEGSGKA